MTSAPVVAAVAVPAAALAVIVGAALLAAGVPVALALALAMAAAALVALWLRLTSSSYSLRALGARPAAPGASPRLENLVEGLCTTHGFPRPELHAVDTDAINAASVGAARLGGHLVVTRGAAERLDRLELEAVVTRQLCQIRNGADPATLLASVARVPVARVLTARLLRLVLERRPEVEVDIEAVRLTSYPPALITALDKAARAPGAHRASAVAHLWMVPPPGLKTPGRTQPTTAERLEVLGEV